MTTLYTVLVAIVTLAVFAPVTQWAGDKAGVPDHGFNLNMKMGWWWLHFLTLIPATLALGWLLAIAACWLLLPH